MSGLLSDPEHSLLQQSRQAIQTQYTVNGDGVGVLVFPGSTELGLYRDTRAAWNDENVESLGRHVHSGLFLARACGDTWFRRSCQHASISDGQLVVPAQRRRGWMGQASQGHRSAHRSRVLLPCRKGQTDSETLSRWR